MWDNAHSPHDRPGTHSHRLSLQGCSHFLSRLREFANQDRSPEPACKLPVTFWRVQKGFRRQRSTPQFSRASTVRLSCALYEFSRCWSLRPLPLYTPHQSVSSRDILRSIREGVFAPPHLVSLCG